MPAENIKRAILRGTGQLEGATIEDPPFGLWAARPALASPGPALMRSTR